VRAGGQQARQDLGHRVADVAQVGLHVGLQMGAGLLHQLVQPGQGFFEGQAVFDVPCQGCWRLCGVPQQVARAIQARRDPAPQGPDHAREQQGWPQEGQNAAHQVAMPVKEQQGAQPPGAALARHKRVHW